MIPVKTAAGHQVLKDRSIKLTPRQRAALILIDGRRSFPDVLQATAAAGIQRGDLERLFELELVSATANGSRSLGTEPTQASPLGEA
jgi:hypothetical protein